MRKPPTGEPYAGEPHVRFGGRGGPNPSRPLSEGTLIPILSALRSAFEARETVGAELALVLCIDRDQLGIDQPPQALVQRCADQDLAACGAGAIARGPVDRIADD